MRTNDERIAAMHERAVQLKQKDRARRVMIAQAVTAAASLAAVILLAVFVPKTVSFSAGVTGIAEGAMQGSMLNGSAAVGYIVIGIIAFIMGTAVTIFCFRLKRWNDEKDKEDRL